MNLAMPSSQLEAHGEALASSAKFLTTPLRADQKYLCITHSDRPASLDKCDLNYLELRYSRADRLPPAIPFGDLAPSAAHSPFGGEITICRIDFVDQRHELVGRLRPEGYKPQHATWHAGRLWVLGVEHLEIYDEQLNSIGRIDDPWLAGGHTIIPDGRGHMLASCSASDSVLVIDTERMKV